MVCSYVVIVKKEIFKLGKMCRDYKIKATLNYFTELLIVVSAFQSASYSA